MVRRATYKDGDAAGLQHPCLGRCIPMTEIGPAHWDRDGLVLTSLQGYSLEAFELLEWTLYV